MIVSNLFTNDSRLMPVVIGKRQKKKKINEQGSYVKPNPKTHGMMKKMKKIAVEMKNLNLQIQP